MHSLLTCLPESKLVKVMGYKYGKPICDMMISCYVGEKKVKIVELQGFRIHFESLNIHDDGDIAKYFQRVDEVVNNIRELNENLVEDVVVKKVLRSLTRGLIPRWQPLNKWKI